MELSTVANIATALTVLTAVVFGLIEMRRARKEREERAALVAVQAILTPAWIQSMTLVQAISQGTTPSQIEADPRLFQAVQSIRYGLPGANWAATLNTNVNAQVRKKIGSGFSGSPSRSTVTAKPEPVSRSARTRLTATGGHDSGLLLPDGEIVGAC